MMGVRNVWKIVRGLLFTERHLWECFVLSFLLVIMMSACTGMKNIGLNDPLLTKHEVVISMEDKDKSMTYLNSDLGEVIDPIPNQKFLWMRPSLSFYNIAGEVKSEKGIRHWMKYTAGSAPVSMSNVDPEQVREILLNRLSNNGYFEPEVHIVKQSKKRKGIIHYLVHPGKQSVFTDLSYPTDSSAIERSLQSTREGSLIRKGDPYSLEVLINERERITKLLQDSGYYYLRNDHFLFNADTGKEAYQVQLRLSLKKDAPDNALHAQRIAQIYVFDDYSLMDYDPDSSLVTSYTYISDNHAFKPEVILSKIALLPGSLYSRTKHYASIENLMDLGVYKNQTLKFIQDSGQNLLNSYFYLTPKKKKSISGELDAVARYTNYVGPLLKLSHQNRNIFGGAEQLSVSLEGSVEFQVGGGTSKSSYRIGLDAELKLPRIIPSLLDRNNVNSGNTIATGGFDLFRRIEYYSLQSFYASYGYNFRGRGNLQYQVKIPSLSFTRTTNKTDLFEEYLGENPSVAKSFEDQFIFGGSFSLLVDRLMNKEHKASYFLSTMLETSGNSLYLLNNLTGTDPILPDDPYKLLGVPYAQYIKVRTEFRYYFQLGEHGTIATKAIAGIGLPFGNSDIMPYIKQYYAGGTNSVRAFLSRSVGPGSFELPEENIEIDQTGDILIESSVEYRYDIIKMLKGAIFLDAGNVWLKNEEPERPGGEFRWNRFYKELAMGSGFGFRLDADFFVLRLDLAWPLYKPYLEQGSRWTVGDINFLNKSWRKDELVFNIAIGYPF